MLQPALTLQLPARRRLIPIATTTAPQIIRCFCAQVYEDYRTRVLQANDEVETAVYEAELSRLRSVFELLGFTKPPWIDPNERGEHV